MGHSFLNLPTSFLNLFTSSPERDSHTNISDWESSFFLLALKPLPDCFLGCHMLGNTKYIICYLSCLCHLWFYRTLLHSPESSFPRLKSHRLLTLLSEETTSNHWASVYLYSSSLFLHCDPFKQVTEIACGIQEMNRELMHSHHKVTVCNVTGHKTSVSGLGVKTW